MTPTYVHATYIGLLTIDNFELLITKTSSSSEKLDEKKGTLCYLKLLIRCWFQRYLKRQLIPIISIKNFKNKKSAQKLPKPFFIRIISIYRLQYATNFFQESNVCMFVLESFFCRYLAK